MPTAKIQFVQPGGGGTGVVGQALIGNLALPVAVLNAADPSVVNSTFEVVSAPPGSAVPAGVAQDGAAPGWSFTPDVRGGYEIHLTTRDRAGNIAEDYRVFQVVETTGRLIPPFGADASSFNFAGQVLGWAPYVGAYLRAVDAGGGGGVLLAGDLLGTGSVNATPRVGSLTGIAGTLALATTAALMQWAAATVLPTIGQAATGAATGATMSMVAQAALTTGGKFVVSSGTGVTAGNVELQTGGVPRFTVSPTLIAAVLPIAAPSLDTSGAAVLSIGTVQATSIDIGVAARPTNILGTCGVVGAFTAPSLDTAAPAVLQFAPTNATSINVRSAVPITFASPASFAPGVTGYLNFGNDVTGVFMAHKLSNNVTYKAISRSGDTLLFGDIVQNTEIDGARVVLSDGTATLAVNQAGSHEVKSQAAFFRFDGTNGVEAMRFTNASGGANTIQFAATVTSATINFANAVVATGAGLTIAAQTTTLAGSTGGALTLASGGGILGPGFINMQCGGTIVAQFKPFSLAFTEGSSALITITNTASVDGSSIGLLAQDGSNTGGDCQIGGGIGSSDANDGFVDFRNKSLANTGTSIGGGLSLVGVLVNTLPVRVNGVAVKLLVVAT